ncbi:protein kinase [Actinomadura sp. LD22]|uniref:non-specific serine/threonine protein kinase n=1 Tax=Actinomadura physcomitrii TaxID=2650748 RepID=A0A6I4MKW6_9ACTN|nr:serine/threonine-protein kinase [Actinomadura physcomitrii]MWA05235.1 protein kinase [Actinomadura physcomitrii]
MTDGPRLAAGTELGGRYRLEGLIGRGGMGEVWRAVDTRLRRPVAVKALPAELADVPGAMERFEREAEATAALQHPGIMVVFDVGRTEDGLAYLVMELLEGEDLRTVMRRRPGGLPIAEAAGLAVQIADALAAAHSRGIVHRDIKPANLFVLADGRLKLCDFGIAGLADAATRLTQDGGSVGTPLYMAPEQYRGEAADFRSDLYAFGCVLHEMLTGGPPFRSGSGMPGLMYAHLNEPPPRVSAVRADVPPYLERLVLDLLAKDVDRRPASAAAVASFLRTEGRWTAVPPSVAPPPARLSSPGLPGPATHPGTVVLTGPLPAGRQAPRLLIAAGAGVAALVAAGALAVIVLPSGGGTGAEREPADPAVPAATTSSVPATPSTPAVHKIVYKVTGSVSPLSVMVMPPDGGMTNQTVKPPWTATYKASRFTFLSVGGNTGIKSGTIHCSITLDGKVIQERSAEGQFASVNCMHQPTFYGGGYGTVPSMG